MRLRGLLILIGAVLVIVTYTVPLWQPLVRPQAAAIADRIIPGMSAQAEQTFFTLPQDQQQAYLAVAATSQPRALAMIRAAFAPPAEAPPLEDEVGGENVGGGSFARLDSVRWGQGEVAVFRQADNRMIIRLSEFSVANAPDLHVYLSRSAEPATPDLMRAENLEIDLGELFGTRGDQTFTVAPEIEMPLYASIALYSPSLDMVYSYATLYLRL